MDGLRRFTPHDELDKWKSTSWNRADQYVFPLHARQLTKWVEGGGKIGLGSHGEVQGLGTHWELWMMASGGMQPHAALKAATIDSADAIGFAKDLGSLEVGKLADLVVLDANPLEDLTNTAKVAEVMKNGRLYDAATLDETYPRQKALEPQWWWNSSRRRPGGAAGRSLGGCAVPGPAVLCRSAATVRRPSIRKVFLETLSLGLDHPGQHVRR